MKVFFLALTLPLLSGCWSPSLVDGKIDPSVIFKVSGVQGTFDRENASYEVKFERPGLSTTVNGVHVTPTLGLTARFSLTGTKAHTVFLGDVPLKEDEVNGFLIAVLNHGSVITSLHNRFLMDSPRIMSIHLEGTGTQEAMAAALGDLMRMLSENRIPLDRPKTVSLEPSKSNLDQKKMESLLWKGEMSHGVFRVSLARATTLKGLKLGGAAGVDSWAAFSGSENNAVVNGDIATLEFELPYVLKTLIESQIRIVSIHTHLTQEKPRLVFVHFWGTGKLDELTTGVKDAIWEKEHFQSQ